MSMYNPSLALDHDPSHGPDYDPDFDSALDPKIEAQGGAPALEIQTVYRQVVIGTRHLFDPRRSGSRGGGARRRGKSRASFVIGAAAGVDAPVSLDYLASASHALVAPAGSGYVVNVTPPMSGEVAVGGQVVSLQDVVRWRGPSFALPPNGRARLECGDVTFLVNTTPRPRALPAPLFVWRWERDSYTVGTAIGLGLFLLMLFALAPDPRSLSFDPFDATGRFAQVLIKAPVEIPDPLAATGAVGAGAPGQRAKDEAGSMGKPTSKNRAARHVVKGPPENVDVDPRLAKQAAEDQIKNTAVLGVLKRMDGSPLAAVFAPDSALGSDTENVLGNLVGNRIAEAYGSGGLSPIGSGSGGGGIGERTIGTGHLATIGKFGQGGNGSDFADGGSGLPLRGRHAHAPDFLAGIPEVRGSLDREIVRRVIRRHLNEVKFCYEQEMLKKPDLGGRIMVQFTIAPGGQVITSVLQSSTMGNARVENCTVQAVRRWEFPEPRGGGLVMVSYPFVLTPAGAGG